MTREQCEIMKKLNTCTSEFEHGSIAVLHAQKCCEQSAVAALPKYDDMCHVDAAGCRNAEETESVCRRSGAVGHILDTIERDDTQ